MESNNIKMFQIASITHESPRRDASLNMDSTLSANSSKQ